MGARLLPWLMGCATVLVGGAYAWVPSFWWDEAATISAANRPLADMVDVHGRIDAVHGLHNLLLHGWFEIAGISEFSARFPGILALGVGAAAVTATAQILVGARLAVATGVLFTVLPRVTWAATEARSYAFAIAAAAVLSLLVVLAVTQRRARWWVLYALVLAVSIVMFVYVATVVCAHAVTVFAVTRGRERVRFFVAAVCAAVLVIPFVVFAYGQVGQVSWIPPLDGRVVRTILVDQWFPGAPWAAVLFAVFVVVGSVVAARQGVAVRERVLLWVAVPGFVVPMVVLLGASLTVSNMYLDRYVAFTVPAMVLLVGWALTRVASSSLTRVASSSVVTAVALVAVVVAVAPAYVEQRQPFGKHGGSDYSTVADRVEQRAEPGECVAFAPKVSWQPTSPRSVADALPDAFDDLDDVGLGETAAARDSLWSTDAPPAVMAQRAVQRCDVLWVIADGERDAASMAGHPTGVSWRFEPNRFVDTDTYRELAAVGFAIVDREPIHRMQLIRFEPVQTQ